MTLTPLILASQSKGRQDMLRGAGLEFTAKPADLDETALIATLVQVGTSPAMIAQKLAQQKALSISQQNPNALVIGSDQILVFEGEIIEKSPSEVAAIQKLKSMAGKSHALISGVALAHQGKIIWTHADTATLKMHSFDDAFWLLYKAQAGAALTKSVGGYWLEHIGSWLFEKIEGDYFTILGMPLLPLLNELRSNHGMIWHTKIS